MAVLSCRCQQSRGIRCLRWSSLTCWPSRWAPRAERRWKPTHTQTMALGPINEQQLLQTDCAITRVLVEVLSHISLPIKLCEGSFYEQLDPWESRPVCVWNDHFSCKRIEKNCSNATSSFPGNESLNKSISGYINVSHSCNLLFLQMSTLIT